MKLSLPVRTHTPWLPPNVSFGLSNFVQLYPASWGRKAPFPYQDLAIVFKFSRSSEKRRFWSFLQTHQTEFFFEYTEYTKYYPYRERARSGTVPLKSEIPPRIMTRIRQLTRKGPTQTFGHTNMPTGILTSRKRGMPQKLVDVLRLPICFAARVE